MPRNMSFALTTQQVKDRSKDVTRRFGWDFVKVGDQLNAVEKAMGLKKGEKIVRLALIVVVSKELVPLNSITQTDVAREGFPDKTPKWFVDMIMDHYRLKNPEEPINRIEFRYN